MKTIHLSLPAWSLLLCLTSPLRAAEDLVLADFEGADYGGWQVSGEAFGTAPAQGALPGQMAVEGFQGKGLVNSFTGGDDSTGTLTSPPFKIERKYLSFLIGGGRHTEKAGLTLLIDGHGSRYATGPNDKSGGSERLEPGVWDVSEFAGLTATLRIHDDAKGGWGHISVDNIRQTDTRPAGIMSEARREFTPTRRYLMLPVKNASPQRVVTLLVNGQKIVRNDICLNGDSPDWWAPMDVSAWQGKQLTLVVDKLPENSTALSAIKESDEITGTEPLYGERLRGQFHFSPARGWNNDPNGMVFHNGEYHLFFQHNPYGWPWGNMHWGHAVSPDMVHWEELGDVLAPDEMGPMFSGSAVVDWKNTSGLGQDGKPPLVLIYTAAGNPSVQCIASSTDGRTFRKYAGNPVLPQITGGNRDPKVIWHGPTKQWVMVLYVEAAGKRHTVQFFTSPDLKSWKLASVAEGGIDGDRYLFECPDFFELPVDGAEGTRKWVLLAANGQYATGTFDGKTFHPEQSQLPGPRGRGYYAPQTYSDIPAADGRRIQHGWFQTETKGMPFNQSMTVPLELRLTQTPDGPRMTWTPVKELAALRSKSHEIPAQELSPNAANPLSGIQAELVELRMEIDPGTATSLHLNVRGAEIVWLAEKKTLTVSGHESPAPLTDGRLHLILYCDRTGLEIFATRGLNYIPMPWQPDPENRSLSLLAQGGTAKIIRLEAHELKFAWRSR